MMAVPSGSPNAVNSGRRTTGAWSGLAMSRLLCEVAWASRSSAAFDGFQYMRRSIYMLLILCALTFVACSYSTAFVVVNDSGQPIEVRYTIKRDAGALSSTDAPVKIAASEAANRYRSQWRSLSPTEYQITHTEHAITVTVQVMPQEALWVTSMFHYFGDDDPNDVASWPLDEITIRGAQGGMSFTGDKSRKAFEYVSRVLYSITYK